LATTRVTKPASKRVTKRKPLTSSSSTPSTRTRSSDEKKRDKARKARGDGADKSEKGNKTERRERPPEDRARTLAMAIAEVGLEYKAVNIEIIDVRGKVDYSDYVVVMSGRSDRQVNALGRHIEEDLKRLHDARCLGIEGMPNGTWLLMDYGDVIVHIFHEDTRGYYDLETLWMDAARVAVES
jgi:ribosome-associated protein